MSRLSDKMRSIRRFHNMTQTEFASEIGVSRTTVIQYEKGNREVNLTTLAKLCDRFNIDPNELILDKNDIKNNFKENSKNLDHIEGEREMMKLLDRLLEMITNIDAKYDRKIDEIRGELSTLKEKIGPSSSEAIPKRRTGS